MANGMDCKSAECQLSADQRFELAWTAVVFKLRVSICETEMLLPPPLGFHGGWQKLLSAFLISIFLFFLGKKFIWSSKCPANCSYFHSTPHTRVSKRDK